MFAAILLMLPVTLILLFVYKMVVQKLQHRALDRGDKVALVLALVAALIFIYLIIHGDWSQAGRIWPVVLAPMGAYMVFAFPLAAYLYYRKLRGANNVQAEIPPTEDH